MATNPIADLAAQVALLTATNADLVSTSQDLIAEGQTVVTEATNKLAALADDTDPAKGAALVGYSGRQLNAKLDEIPSLGDFADAAAAVTDLTASVGGGTLLMPAGNGAATLPASTGKVLLDYDGPDVNLSAFGEVPSSAWSTAKLLRYQNNTTHSGAGQSAFAIESRPVGSGTNGPTSADYGQTISVAKKDFDTTSVVGEIDGLTIGIRQGGAASDACAILANVATYGTGFMGAMESSTSAVTAGVITQGVRAQVGIVDNLLGNQYGVAVIKDFGVNSGDGYYVGDGAAGASFANAFRVNYLARDVYKVSAYGEIRLTTATGAALTKTIYNNAGSLVVLNNAESAQILALTDAGNFSVAGTLASVGALTVPSATVGGAVSAVSLVATGPGGAGTVSATGAITGASVTATGNVGGATVTSTGAMTAAGALKSTSASGGVGYATGAGGTVTQLTSKSTGVTINTPCGSIVTHNASLASGATVSFTVTNSAVAQEDMVIVKRRSGGGALSYFPDVDSIANGSFVVYLQNITGGALAEAVTLNFAVIKSVTA